MSRRMREYWIGHTAELEITVRNHDGVLTSPTSIGVTVEKPGDSDVSPTALELSEGIYRALVPTDESGIWDVRVEVAGNDTDAVAETSFRVKPSSVEDV